MTQRYREALEYHSKGRKGKIEVVATKPCATQQDLSMAYTPGVAEPCRAIFKNPDDVFKYTAKGNLVAVVTNGTAVLGLGDIGPMAGKPVMEGKAILFKRFADIDVFDIELDAPDVETVVQTVQALAPTFGGINLEDIAAPNCFEIEKQLSDLLDIPVFHDDQHGTAIISAAAFLNALELKGKDIKDVKVVFSGAGAAAIATARLYRSLGLPTENIILVDSRGVCYVGRTHRMNKYKQEFAVETEARTLGDAMKGADVFVGCSVKGVLTQDMVRTMADDPIIFAMANPDPEIAYEDAVAVRSDLIMATGRSDYPNQVNNVLGFPFIFRGALDVRARKINEEMKVAAVRALAELAKQDVPDTVLRAYGLKRLQFGPDYIIPKPFDPRVLLWVAPAVAQAAMDTGVAREPIEDMDAYMERLESILGRPREVMRPLLNRAKKAPKRLVFPEGDNPRILRACQIIVEEGIAHPILLGNREEVTATANDLGLQIDKMQIIDPEKAENCEEYTQKMYQLRQRRGVTQTFAKRNMHSRTTYGCMMVDQGDADGLVGGLGKSYQDTLRPALQIVGAREHKALVSGVYLIVLKERLFFFGDCTVNIDPNSQQLADIAINTAEVARTFRVEPRIAMLSFSNFGSAPDARSTKVRKATDIIHRLRPDLEVDGEMQADTAVSTEVRRENFPFTLLQGDANVLIFPDLQSGNIAYKLLQRLAGATAIGPLLVGMGKPVNVLPTDSDVSDIVNIAAITAVEAEDRNFLAGWKGAAEQNES